LIEERRRERRPGTHCGEHKSGAVKTVQLVWEALGSQDTGKSRLKDASFGVEAWIYLYEQV
jgi:hypothetical protein